MKRLSIATLAVVSLAIAVAGCGGGGVVVKSTKTTQASTPATTTPSTPIHSVQTSARLEGATTLAKEPRSTATAIALGHNGWTEAQIRSLVESSLQGTANVPAAFAECMVTYMAVLYTPEEALQQERTRHAQLVEEETQACGK